MVMYAQESNLAVLNPAELSERLAAVLRDAMPWLVTISEAEASVPECLNKWSAKQVMGHLTDSAVNNLARIVRIQIASGQDLPGYEQMAWVRLQKYDGRPWPEVLRWARLRHCPATRTTPGRRVHQPCVPCRRRTRSASNARRRTDRCYRPITA